MANASKALSDVVIGHVVKHVRSIERRFTPVLGQVIRAHPEYTSDQVLNNPLVVTYLSLSLHEARNSVIDELRTAYVSAGLLGTQISRRDFRVAGLEFPQFTWHGDSAYRDSVLRDINTMFLQARNDIRSSIAEAFNAVEPDQYRLPIERVRALDSRLAVHNAVRRLSARAQAAASVVVTRALAEAQLETYRTYQEQNPGQVLRKRWVALSAHPCPACRALHGVELDLDEEFDHTASTSQSFSLPKVYFNLLCPPRHPRCKCKLVLVSIAVIVEEIEEAVKTPLPYYVYLDSEEVRTMPSSKYQSLVKFLKAVFTRVKRVVRRLTK